MPQDQVFWYLKPSTPQRLTKTITTDVVIIGGGMAGISAAQSFRKRGLNVVLIEKYFCGAGATGKSSGFITPDSELGLPYFARHYGVHKAQALWELVTGGMQLIQDNIVAFNIGCDYQQQETLVVANKKRDYASFKEEHDLRSKLGYTSTLYQQNELPTVLGSSHYYGGLRSGGTFGIHAYAYVQHMKDRLQEMGVAVYEETPALSIAEHTVQTPLASIKANYIIVCIDRWAPDLGILTKDIYHAQTFLMVSPPLIDKIVQKIFPQDHFMVWDTDHIYTYYRLIHDNRFLVGGGSWLRTLAQRPTYHADSVYRTLTSYIKKKFPEVTLTFSYRWPGLIGITKDIMAYAGRDPHVPNIYYIAGASGLPWAAALGAYSVENLLDNRTDFDTYFSPTRTFIPGHTAQRFIGKRATFALATSINLFLKPYI
jgi:gamma-glutamylputrescine oxidase